MKTRSLRRNLVFVLLALTLAAWTVAALVSVSVARGVVMTQVDRQLTQYLDIAHHTTGTIFQDDKLKQYYRLNAPTMSSSAGITRVSGFGNQGAGQAINFWFDRSQVVVGEQAPAFPEPRSEGYVIWTYAEGDTTRHWRLLYREDRDLRLWIGVGVDLDQAVTLGNEALLKAALPLLVILPISVVILLLGVAHGLKPLERLAHTIEDRHPQALTPIDDDDVPTEMRPVVHALNGLLLKLERALASEARFTANAAHELQTPLASIKAEVQHAAQGTQDTELKQLLQRILERVDRAATTVRQLLTIARLDPDQDIALGQVDVESVVMEVLAEHGQDMLDRQLDIDVTRTQGSMRVHGNREWLEILLQNLITNAIKYTTPASSIEVSMAAAPDAVTLMIANDSVPIADDEFHRLTERFFRGTHDSQQGAGLGLSIATRIAELHSGRLDIARWRDERGFRVELTLRPA